MISSRFELCSGFEDYVVNTKTSRDLRLDEFCGVLLIVGVQRTIRLRGFTNRQNKGLTSVDHKTTYSRTYSMWCLLCRLGGVQAELQRSSPARFVVLQIARTRA